MMQTLLQDIRYGIRILIKNPGFTIVAVLTLALGIGANTAIFTMVNSVLLSSLPVKDPSQLVALTDPDSHGMSVGSQDGDRALLTYAEFQAMSERNHAFSGVLALESGQQKINVATEGQTDEGAPASINMVSGSYFSVLGVNPILGRAFTTEVDKVRDANPVAVISYRFWQSRFGADKAILGRKIRIRSTSFDIVGVAPPQFQGITVGFAPDIWVPLTMQAELFPGEDFLSVEKNPVEKTEWLQVLARRKPGVTLAQAKADAEVTFQQYLESQIGTGITPEDKREFLNQHIALVDGSHGTSSLHERFGKPLVILMGVVGLVLLIACANVANLLLARAASRQKEIAVRVSLGAGPGRLFRQLLTESLLLSGIGGAIGLLLAQWADALLLQLVSRDPSPVPLDVHPDTRILGFTLGVSLLTGILFGLAPAIRAARVDLNTALKGTSKGVVGGAARGGRLPLGKILVVAQVALSLVLLIVAGLFVHSFAKLTQVQLGFDHDHLLLFAVDAVTAGYKGPAAAQLYKDLAARIEAVPGVRAVSFSHNGLFSGSESSDEISIEAYTPKSGQKMNARFDHVGPNYFSTVGIPVLVGREIGPQDEGSGQRVGLINQTMARYYFGDESPLGRRIWDMFPTTHTDFVVVGVVADAKYNSLSEVTPRRFYLPTFQPLDEGETRFAKFEVRAAGDPYTIAASVRQVVKQTAATLPPIEMETMDELVSQSLTSDRMITKLSGFFGALAALLACIGIYGIMGYAVAGRTNEIGIRMALGAQSGNVLWLVLRESLLLVGVGVAIGLPAVIGAAKLISSLLFGLTPADPVALVLATLLMFAVAALAGYIPARRASRIDPMVALRYE
ncbi:MAG: ABC transporter permease [Candidatus Acidiferrales bacterium]